MLIQRTVSEEKANIISTFNMNKSSGPNCIPYKILNLLEKDTSIQNDDLYNLSLSPDVF